jgi:hypothetical protein
MLDYLTVNTSLAAERPRASLGLRISEDSTIEATDPIWLVAIWRQIDHLLLLGENWNSEGAPSISFEAAMGALMFLLQNSLHDMPAPQVMPMSDGGVQIEWHILGTDFELAFPPLEPPSFYYSDAKGLECEGELEQEMLTVASILRGLPSEDERYRSNG